MNTSPDSELVQLIAADLGVDASFIEKDWYAIAIACVSPIETAADKLSALTWRVLSQQRGNKQDDPTLIRHLHDLTALENFITAYEDFPNLVITLLEEDAGRDKDLNLSALAPIERLLLMLQYLEEDAVYADEYERFVTGMSYAAEDERPTFSQALDSVRHIVFLMS